MLLQETDLGGGVRRTELLFDPLEQQQLGTYQCLERDTFSTFTGLITVPVGECSAACSYVCTVTVYIAKIIFLFLATV